MAKSLASLRRVKAVNPPSMIAYGVHGVGKTTFASEWPDPVFIQCEQGTPGGLELNSFGAIESFGDVLDAIGSLLTEPHDFKTVVIDSLDAMEPLIWEHVCRENKWNSIEDAGYGKGYIMLDTYWREFLDACHALTCVGISVVQIAHSAIERFDSPTSDPYSRYVVKLHKRAAALVQEAADIVGFFNYRISLKQKEVGFQKTVTHGEGGGARLMHFEERPGFLAKNRYQMPAQVEYKPGAGFSAISKYFPMPTGLSAQQRSAA
jgi:hypothetical protein